MDFQVKRSAEAELDALGILEWLMAQHAGETAFDGFWQSKMPFRRLRSYCSVGPWHQKTPSSRLKSANGFMGADLIFIGSSSPSTRTPSTFLESATVFASV
jgi:hypothetical protein